MNESRRDPTQPDDSGAGIIDSDYDWAGYHAATRHRPARPLLIRAVSMLPRGGKALDLGCGAGNDTRYLLEQGFDVTAVDATSQAVGALRELGEERLRPVLSTFAEFTFDADGYDLINAQYALPFNPQDSFPELFARLKRALRPGAIFTGQFFGVRHEWNTPETDLSFHTRAEAETLLDGLNLVEFDEVAESAATATGGMAFFHTFEIIARKPATT
jgi:SAM-dependent methyltransferase